MIEFTAKPKKKSNGLLTPVIGGEASPNGVNSVGIPGVLVKDAPSNSLANVGKGLAPKDPAIAATATNKSILAGLGIDIDTVLTPKGKRKKKAVEGKSNPLRGGDIAEVATLGG